MDEQKGLAIVGGSFNPPHHGHLRLALEISENLSNYIARTLIVPCARPPHKVASHMLPFDLRVRMLEVCLKNYPHMDVSRIEGERDTLSYTWETLLECQKRYPGWQLYFTMGMDDYLQLHTWYHGLDLYKLCHLIVVSRGTTSFADFCRATKTLWPNSVPNPNGEEFCRIADQAKSYFLDIPWLNISSTMLRNRWLKGLSLDFLVPDAVLQLLTENKLEVNAAWSE